MSRYDRKFETREMIPRLCHGLLVKDGGAVSRVDNSGGGICARYAKAQPPGATWPCLNASKEVPRLCVKAGKAPRSCTGNAEGPRPDAVVLCQSAVQQYLAMTPAAVLSNAKKAYTIHHIPASELGDSMPWICRQFNSYLIRKTVAKEKQIYVGLAHSQETLPHTAHSTHLFVDKRMPSFDKLLPTLEDGSFGEDPK